jgi:hypothetical protein
MWSSSSGHSYCQGKLFQNLVHSRMHVSQNSTGHNGVEANLLFSGNPALLMNLVLSQFTNWAIETKNCMSLKWTIWDSCTAEWWDWIPSRNKRLVSLKIFKTSSMSWCLVMHSDNFAFTWHFPRTHFTAQWCDHHFLQSSNHFSVMFII